jgi:CheY-like chemotaxis protein
MPHILLVGDHRIVTHVLKETLEAEGWRVTICYDGSVAVTKLARKAAYDLLLLDNHPPNVDGLELARYVRGLPHRRETPIIMFSASGCSRHAQLAGVNEFLQKPQDIGKTVEVIARLLTSRSGFS